MTLVTLQTKTFTATVPVFHLIPIHRLREILDEENSMKQFTLTVGTLLDAMAPDKQDAFKELEMAEAIEVVTEWLKASNEYL